jgi:hypothetical protein
MGEEAGAPLGARAPLSSLPSSPPAMHACLCSGSISFFLFGVRLCGESVFFQCKNRPPGPAFISPPPSLGGQGALAGGGTPTFAKLHGGKKGGGSGTPVQEAPRG